MKSWRGFRQCWVVSLKPQTGLAEAVDRAHSTQTLYTTSGTGARQSTKNGVFEDKGWRAWQNEIQMYYERHSHVSPSHQPLDNARPSFIISWLVESWNCAHKQISNDGEKEISSTALFLQHQSQQRKFQTIQNKNNEKKKTKKKTTARLFTWAGDQSRRKGNISIKTATLTLSTKWVAWRKKVTRVTLHWG